MGSSSIFSSRRGRATSAGNTASRNRREPRFCRICVVLLISWVLAHIWWYCSIATGTAILLVISGTLGGRRISAPVPSGEACLFSVLLSSPSSNVRQNPDNVINNTQIHARFAEALHSQPRSPVVPSGQFLGYLYSCARVWAHKEVQLLPEVGMPEVCNRPNELSLPRQYFFDGAAPIAILLP
jgi:hypothetical protein